MITITVLGSGNVAHHLILNILEQDTLSLQQIYARNKHHLTDIVPEELITNDISALKPTDIFIVAVSDNAISEVSNDITVPNQLVVHVAGNTPMDTIAAKHRKGVLYMLQTFSKDKKVDLSKVPFCLEASDAKDLKLLETIALTFSERIYFIDSNQRKAVHLAAVFANNFANHMYALGEEVCKEHAIPFDILKPLILETAEKTEYLAPKQAQTGPAIRNDSQTIARHLEMLKDPNKREIYKLITKSIQEK